MTTLTRLLETGQLRIVVDRTFPLEEAAGGAALPRVRPARGTGRHHRRRLTRLAGPDGDRHPHPGRGVRLSVLPHVGTGATDPC